MEREKNVTERYRRMLEESKTPLAIAQVKNARLLPLVAASIHAHPRLPLSPSSRRF